MFSQLKPGSLLLLAAASLPLFGCNNFFVCQKSSCPSSGGGSTSGSGNYLYVSNPTGSSTSLAAYDISKGAFTAIGSPLKLGYVPVALSVTPSDAFLYVASIPGAASPGVYVYSIGSGGALSAGNGGAPVAADEIASMDISPDGKFLFTVNVTGLSMTEYQINSNGSLTITTSVQLPGLGCALTQATPASQSCSVKVSPSGQFVVVALGTAGDVIFSYNSTSGVTGIAGQIPSGATASNPTGDFSVALDKNNFAYIARTSTLAVYSIAANGAAAQRSTSSYGAGAVPRSVTLGGSGNYVYTANEGSSTISEFGIGTKGDLTQLNGSPVAAPTNVSALGVDKTGAYLVAAGYNSTAGVQIFTVGSNGVLSPTASTGSGTSTAYPAVLALTH